MPDTQRPMAVTLQVVSIVLFTFIGYLNIGIPWLYCRATCIANWAMAP